MNRCELICAVEILVILLIAPQGREIPFHVLDEKRITYARGTKSVQVHGTAMLTMDRMSELKRTKHGERATHAMSCDQNTRSGQKTLPLMVTIVIPAIMCALNDRSVLLPAIKENAECLDARFTHTAPCFLVTGVYTWNQAPRPTFTTLSFNATACRHAAPK